MVQEFNCLGQSKVSVTDDENIFNSYFNTVTCKGNIPIIWPSRNISINPLSNIIHNLVILVLLLLNRNFPSCIFVHHGEVAIVIASLAE